MHRAEQLAVDVELALPPRAVADADRRRPPPAGQVRQLALGQVALAADAEHDLQVAVLVEGSGRRRSVMYSKNSLASSGHAATHSASMVNDASRTQA